MPHHTFTVAEVASYLHLLEADIRQLVRRREIPFETQREQPVFRRSQIDAWASQRILGMSGGRVQAYHKAAAARVHEISRKHALMPELTAPERIAIALTSRTKPSVLRDMVALAEGTGLVCDPAELLATIEAREELCSTALPDGYALLHPRQHEPYMFVDSFIVFGRTVQPIHAGSHDGLPSDLFFLVCCQNDAIHLHTLARLCTMSLHTDLLKKLRAAETAAEMFAAIRESEMEILRRP